MNKIQIFGEIMQLVCLGVSGFLMFTPYQKWSLWFLILGIYWELKFYNR